MDNLSQNSKIGRFEIRSERIRLGAFGWAYLAFESMTQRMQFLKVLEPFERVPTPGELDTRRLVDGDFCPYEVHHEQIDGRNADVVVHSRFRIGVPVAPEASVHGMPGHHDYKPYQKELSARGPREWYSVLPRIVQLTESAIGQAAGKPVLVCPANLFLYSQNKDEHGRPQFDLQLLDVGLDYDAGEFQNVTDERGDPHALAYVPPESLRALWAGVDRKGDQVDPAREAVYSIAMTAYWLLSGPTSADRSLPPGLSTVAEIRRSMSVRKRVIAPFGDIVNQRALAAFSRALDPDPARRPATGSEFLQELAAVEDWTVRDPRPRSYWATLGCVAAAVVAGFAWLTTWFFSAEQRFQRSELLAELRAAHRARGHDALGKELQDDWFAGLQSDAMFRAQRAALRFGSRSLASRNSIAELGGELEQARALCAEQDFPAEAAMLGVFRAFLEWVYPESGSPDVEMISELLPDGGSGDDLADRLSMALRRLSSRSQFESPEEAQAFIKSLTSDAGPVLGPRRVASEIWYVQHIAAECASKLAPPSTDRGAVSAAEHYRAAATLRGNVYSDVFSEEPWDAPQNPAAWGGFLQAARGEGLPPREIVDTLEPMVRGRDVLDEQQLANAQELRGRWLGSLGIEHYQAILVAYCDAFADMARDEPARFKVFGALVAQIRDGRFLALDVDGSASLAVDTKKLLGFVAQNELASLIAGASPDHEEIQRAYVIAGNLIQGGASELDERARREVHRARFGAVFRHLGNPDIYPIENHRSELRRLNEEAKVSWLAATGLDSSVLEPVAVGQSIPPDRLTAVRGARPNTAQELFALHRRTYLFAESPGDRRRLDAMWTAREWWSVIESMRGKPFEDEADLVDSIYAEWAKDGKNGGSELAGLFDERLALDGDRASEVALARAQWLFESGQFEAAGDQLARVVAVRFGDRRRLLGAKIALGRVDPDDVPGLLVGIDALEGLLGAESAEVRSEAEALYQEKVEGLCLEIVNSAKSTNWSPLTIVSHRPEYGYGLLADESLRPRVARHLDRILVMAADRREPQAVSASSRMLWLRLLALEKDYDRALKEGLALVGISRGPEGLKTRVSGEAPLQWRGKAPAETRELLTFLASLLLLNSMQGDRPPSTEAIDAANKLLPSDPRYAILYARALTVPILAAHPYVKIFDASRGGLNAGPNQLAAILDAAKRLEPLVSASIEGELDKQEQLELYWHAGVLCYIAYTDETTRASDLGEPAYHALAKLTGLMRAGTKPGPDLLGNLGLSERMKVIAQNNENIGDIADPASQLFELCANLYLRRMASAWRLLGLSAREQGAAEDASRSAAERARKLLEPIGPSAFQFLDYRSDLMTELK